MAFKNFSRDLFCAVFDNDDLVKIATHTLREGGELSNLRILVFSKGSNTGTLKLSIYPKGNTDEPICTSDNVDIQEIGNNFLGFVRFDFGRNSLQAGFEYDIFSKIEGYSRNEQTNYVALVFDYPVSVYDNEQAGFFNHPIAIEDFVFI